MNMWINKSVFACIVGIVCSFLVANFGWSYVWADTEQGSTNVQFQVGESVCGNGIVDFGEACDDGNVSNQDGCINTCEIASCGDGFVRSGIEECDAGGSNGSCPASCSNSCTENSCGGGDDPPIINITTVDSTFSTIEVTWTATNGPITGCVISWGTTIGGPYPSSTMVYTELFGTYEALLTGLLPETTYDIRVLCTNAASLSGDDTIIGTTLALPDTEMIPLTILATPELRVSRPGGNLDTDFTVFVFDATETTLLGTVVGTSNPNGTYTAVHELPLGSGYVAVHKSDSHLAKKIINVTIASDGTVLDFTAGGTFALIAGDVKPEDSLYATLQDNIIDILDITYIDSNDIINTDDRIADLNRDGIVDILDLTLVDSNSDRQGDLISL